MRGALTRLADAHRRTLDQLSTGVAMFDANHRLTFFNAAYRALWDLDAGFLDQGPTDSAVIDVLRAARKLPEEQDFRQWKAQLHEAYRAVEAKEHTWHLPGGRTLRVVTTPNPDGGVTYLFHDVTERLDLERRFEELIRVQGETLDNLAEGVAVFGSDGRLRLHNAAFARMWRLRRKRSPTARISSGSPRYASRCTAMRRPGRRCAMSSPRSTAAKRRRAASSGATAASSTARTVPLPDGATLVTFHDVTDSVNVERALARAQRSARRRRQDQDRFRPPRVVRTALAAHQYYRLRPSAGRPDDRPACRKAARISRLHHGLDQYVAGADQQYPRSGDDRCRPHAAQSRAGRYSRNHGGGGRRRAGSAGRLGSHARDRRADNIGSFIADKLRVRQILFNLLANAASFSPPRRDRHAARRAAGRRGRLLGHRSRAREFRRKCWKRCSTGSRPIRSARSIADPGIGLSLVRSFVELHGGTVAIASAVGQGTTVTCTFPLGATAALTAAE